MIETKGSKPDFVQDCHLSYLDAVRESGLINMFGAAYWMANFKN